ncbi:hypothetical protein CHS0354_027903 [Potamilus streckersoni]|uniref:Uncharacterized protein n=1 Tax=Potamilus streckersoni TaxID=2493646 RepID=A0AAE0T3V4_9BIVA|nr:hypothetical protein CHS0354_027903 [Potamilus streckersoni]
MADLLGMAFIPYYRHLMELLETNKELKKTSKGIFKQMAWAAGGAAVGGIVGGPPGALFGSIAGSFMGYIQSDDYKSMVAVLKNMSDADKKKLVQKVQELVGSSTIEALTSFIGSQVQRELLLGLIRDFANDVKGG